VYLQVNHDESWIETLICIDESARASPSQLVTEVCIPSRNVVNSHVVGFF
jgi:hypothetical protein